MVGVAPGGVEPPRADSKLVAKPERPRRTETDPCVHADSRPWRCFRLRPLSAGLVAPRWPHRAPQAGRRCLSRRRATVSSVPAPRSVEWNALSLASREVVLHITLRESAGYTYDEIAFALQAAQPAICRCRPRGSRSAGHGWRRGRDSFGARSRSAAWRRGSRSARYAFFSAASTLGLDWSSVQGSAGGGLTLFPPPG
jgi:hypothetical protein